MQEVAVTKSPCASAFLQISLDPIIIVVFALVYELRCLHYDGIS